MNLPCFYPNSGWNIFPFRSNNSPTTILIRAYRSPQRQMILPCRVQYRDQFDKDSNSWSPLLLSFFHRFCSQNFEVEQPKGFDPPPPVTNPSMKGTKIDPGGSDRGTEAS